MMQTKADSIKMEQLLTFYRQKAEQLEYNLTVEKMVNQQYQSLLETLIKNHPKLEKEVMDNDSSQTQSGAKQKRG